jgi:hypothetical protein
VCSQAAWDGELACGAWPGMTARVSALVPNGLSFHEHGNLRAVNEGREAHLPGAGRGGGPGQM